MHGKRNTIKIFVITPFVNPDWRWLEHWFDSEKYQWSFYQADLISKSHKKIWWWLYHTYKAASKIDDSYQLVVTHGPWLALYMSIMMKLMRKKNTLIASTFNHGNQIFFSGVFFYLSQRFMLPKVSLYITYSESERKIYSSKYNIPLEKLSFTHWAVKKPEAKEKFPDFLDITEQYICTIGRNNRDLDLFLKAVEGLPVKSIIICREGQLNTDQIRDKNLMVLTDITFDECNRILSHSLINVVPLIDASTGAGHMTIVNAMLYGIPQVITEISTVEEYFIHEKHGYLVKQADVDSMKNALLTLINNPDLRKEFGDNAQKFANKWFTEEAAYRSLKAVIDSEIASKNIPLVPPGWS